MQNKLHVNIVIAMFFGSRVGGDLITIALHTRRDHFPREIRPGFSVVRLVRSQSQDRLVSLS